MKTETENLQLETLQVIFFCYISCKLNVKIRINGSLICVHQSKMKKNEAKEKEILTFLKN